MGERFTDIRANLWNISYINPTFYSENLLPFLSDTGCNYFIICDTFKKTVK